MIDAKDSRLDHDAMMPVYGISVSTIMNIYYYVKGSASGAFHHAITPLFYSALFRIIL
jgi:hypothetical protein